MPKETPEKAGKSVTLSFTSPEELRAYNDILTTATADDRSVNSFIVRVLLGKESFTFTAVE